MSETANILIEIVRTPQNIRKIYDEFNGNIFENKYFTNVDYLLDNSTTTKFKQQWNLNPHKFCYENYSISELSPVILLVNKLNSMFEIKSENLKGLIITPSLSSIFKVLTLIA